MDLPAELHFALDVDDISAADTGCRCDSDRMPEAMVTEIDARSRESERLMLWIVAVATLLGIFLAIVITRHISGPLRKMAGMLDRLAYEEPTERMSYVTGGRDEVNAMAESVNTMADHRERFIDWWKTSMKEAEACQKMEQMVRFGAASGNA